MNNLQSEYDWVHYEALAMESAAWIRLRTYNGIPFQYRQMQNGDRQIEYGSLPFRATITQEVYQQLVQHFSGKTVCLGAVYDNPPPGSLGAWLSECLPGRNLAMYVGSILVEEGQAAWGKSEEGACLHFIKIEQ
jgi:hypothetical protein